MELVKVGEKTYYIKNATNIGIFKFDDTNVYLIDTGNDKDAGKKILKIIDEQGWKVKGIINTHSNADHIGGNKVIQDRTNCTILAHNMEKAFTEFPILEPSFLLPLVLLTKVFPQIPQYILLLKEYLLLNLFPCCLPSGIISLLLLE